MPKFVFLWTDVSIWLLAAALVPEPRLRVLRLARYYALATASIALGTLDRLRQGPPAAWEKSEGTR